MLLEAACGEIEDKFLYKSLLVTHCTAACCHCSIQNDWLGKQHAENKMESEIVASLSLLVLVPTSIYGQQWIVLDLMTLYHSTIYMRVYCCQGWAWCRWSAGSVALFRLRATQTLLAEFMRNFNICLTKFSEANDFQVWSKIWIQRTEKSMSMVRMIFLMLRKQQEWRKYSPQSWLMIQIQNSHPWRE